MPLQTRETSHRAIPRPTEGATMWQWAVEQLHKLRPEEDGRDHEAISSEGQPHASDAGSSLSQREPRSSSCSSGGIDKKHMAPSPADDAGSGSSFDRAREARRNVRFAAPKGVDLAAMQEM